MKSEMLPSYAAVIIHYLNPELMQEAVRSLRSQTHLPDQIIVVDNSASIAELELDDDLFGLVQVIRAPRNGGYAYAANLARDRVEASGVTKLLVMTQDVLWEPNTVEKLAAASTDGRACVAPRIMLRSEPTKVFSCGGRLTFGGNTPHLKSNQRGIRSSDGVINVDWVDGAILFLNLASLNKVGWFDESFFLYYEEVDLCYRLRSDLSESIVVVEDAIAYQEPGNYTAYFRFRNQVLFWRKHFDSWEIWPRMTIQFIRKFARSVLKVDPSLPIWAIRGLLDGARRRGGPAPVSPYSRQIESSVSS